MSWSVSKLESWRRSELESWRGIELVSVKFRKLLFLHIDGSQIKKSAFSKHDVNRKVVDNHLINITGKFEPSSNSIFREIGK